MLFKNTQIPKSQYPNSIRKDYRDKYLISYQEKTLIYSNKNSILDIDKPRSQRLYRKMYLTSAIYEDNLDPNLTFSSDKESLPIIRFFSSLKEAKKHLIILSEKLITFNKDRYKKYYSKDLQILIVSEFVGHYGHPHINYKLYQIEKLLNNNVKKQPIPCQSCLKINEKPSSINQYINWKITLW